MRKLITFSAWLKLKQDSKAVSYDIENGFQFYQIK